MRKIASYCVAIFILDDIAIGHRFMYTHTVWNCSTQKYALNFHASRTKISNLLSNQFRTIIFAFCWPHHVGVSESRLNVKLTIGTWYAEVSQIFPILFERFFLIIFPSEQSSFPSSVTRLQIVFCNSPELRSRAFRRKTPLTNGQDADDLSVDYTQILDIDIFARASGHPFSKVRERRYYFR